MSDTFDIKNVFEQTKELYGNLIQSVDFNDTYLRYSLIWVAFNPIFWNIVARLEYNTHFLTKIAGSAKAGCYTLAVIIFTLGIGRDHMFNLALQNQETSPFLQIDILQKVGYTAIVIGQILVLSSMYQLGITGTYLGDYFGILMKDRVTSFPFNVSNNPMYQGSTLSFLGISLIKAKPAGLIVALAVQFMYDIALQFEEPFTAKIYANRDKLENEKKNL
ncbi:similar to Saccharomyces cerevisiae YJR073C OPI3 Phospholipid methyltransferase (methylene-fatty-acyl-phospholipid synthase) [Maudiozyma saulgeensis]|uniref:Phosphatidyl-N-methylethanolamine N-methyltransferase n=1 Tax=Maudiozyma saulgeensis TaxID=1789683 RepID=A0A1X7R192_9SACH|nr:similar to Saccharomyces cerevisiae YJR073C OPI3 Phospholipid methyltransferase (methylene-fatty-acyl-phospholipid synthase) [Kazachstania saulgeensis]